MSGMAMWWVSAVVWLLVLAVFLLLDRSLGD